MVERNSASRLGPKRRLSVKAGVRFCIVVTLFVLYGVFTSGRGENLQETHNTGRSLLWHMNEIPEVGARNCTRPAILDFPPDLFTPEQRRSGGIIVHIIICLYLFVLLAMICDDYFVPCIEKMCEQLNVSEDIAGATFMAAAVSSPEFFINVVGTFITEGDIGVGTIVGSAVFNVLAVPACCGLFAKKVVKLNWWSLTRDCAIYSVAVSALMLTVWDGRIEWYESLTLVSFYIFYILAMYYNDEASNWMNVFCCRKNRYGYVQIENAIMNGNGTPHVLVKAKENGHADMNGHLKGDVQNVHYRALNIEEEIGEEESNDECCLTVANCFKKIWWLFTGPIDVILAITIPDCKREFWKRFYLLTFLMCILWIGFTSYVVAWMITTIGDTFQIPDSVMGLTFLAAGMSVPEAVSSVIVTNQGHGSMGISNSIGSNTFDILLCLGLPWLLKSALLPGETGGHFVQINSRGISYSVISLFTTLFLLYITFFLNNFKLDYKAGFVCLAIYIIFLVMASLIELDVFFPVNLPVCGR